MKKIFIEEPLFSTTCWFVMADEVQLNKWLKSQFDYKLSKNNIGHKRDGCTIIILDEEKNTYDRIVFQNTEFKTPAVIAHEVIHLVFDIFNEMEIEFCKETEELFARLHTYYYSAIIEFLNKNKMSTK